MASYTRQRKPQKSYEKDNFRKPAGAAWMSDHAALQAALTAAKDEARALREAAEGQVSTTEAVRLRGRAAEAEAALEAAVKERCVFWWFAYDFCSMILRETT